MNQSDNERQRQIEVLNASLRLPPPQWIPAIGAQIQALYFGEWLPAILLSCPNNNPDPQQRISGWKIRLLTSGLESYVWELEHLNPTGEDSDDTPF